MNKTAFFKNIKFGRLSAPQIIFTGIAVILAVTSFYFVRGLVTCWTITPLPGRPPANCGTVTAGQDQFVLNSEGTPVPDIEVPPPPIAIPDSELPPAWDGASRINILIIGLDYRDWEAGLGAPRSDTMILLTIDPLTKTAGMLSIPRDMWVNIPGFGYSRINTAYSSGEGNRLPGGGPELAKKTVEQFIGVDIQYYAQIDFLAFVEFIDLIGGIEVYNDEELRLDPVGEGKDKIRMTCCGMRRQQKAILAIRDKVLNPENFPVLLGKARQFYEEFSAGIKTNMPFDTALQLGVLAKDIPIESIEPGVIDYTMVALDSTVLGGENASILKPLPDKIRILRDEIFTSGGPLSPLAAQYDPNALMRADAARVRLQNGSFTPSLEVKTGNFLIAQGMAVTEAGPADRVYDRTVVILYSGKLYTLKYLQALIGIDSSMQILIRPDPTSTVDVEVRLGNDWANSNQIP